MPLGAFFGKFFGNTIGEAAGYGIGSALEKPLAPPLQELTNETWRAATAAGATVPIEPGDAAEIVAESVELEAWGADQAAQTGIGSAQFSALVQAVLNAPGTSELLTMWRRGFIGKTDFAHGLRKARLETRWDGALEKLKDAPLAPAVAALAVVRGLIADEGTLPVAPPTEQGVIPPFPVYPISGKDAAAAVGLSEDAYAVMVGINGRPMSLHEAASAYFRGIIELPDYQRAVAEGDTRNEWRDAILEQARQILSAHDWAELHLRGWVTSQEMYDGTALHGMSQADTDLLFKNLGRPIPVHQVTTGLARGGTYNGDTSIIPNEYLRAMQEGNSRPEWYNLEYANRYTLPGYFVVKAMLSNGTLTVAEGAEIFKQEGWPPDLADKAAAALAGGTSGGTKKLTPTQVKIAYHAGQLDRAQAVQRLEDDGYTAADASLVLGNPPPPA